MTDPPDQHEDELGPPLVEDLTDPQRELEREQADRAAMEAALAELRGGAPETARRTLAAHPFPALDQNLLNSNRDKDMPA